MNKKYMCWEVEKNLYIHVHFDFLENGDSIFKYILNGIYSYYGEAEFSAAMTPRFSVT